MLRFLSGALLEVAHLPYNGIYKLREVEHPIKKQVRLFLFRMFNLLKFRNPVF